jgi:hypothetical protein
LDVRRDLSLQEPAGVVAQDSLFLCQRKIHRSLLFPCKYLILQVEYDIFISKKQEKVVCEYQPDSHLIIS